MKLRNLILTAVVAGAIGLAACTVPAWVNTVEADAQIAAPIAASLIDVIDPSLSPLVSLVENGFTALAKTLDAYKASPTATNLQAVQAAFAAVNSNVAQLESAAQIKNAATATTVTEVVQLLTQAVTEIAALVPAKAELGARDSGLGNVKAAAHIPNSGSRIPKGWQAKDFKEQFNKIVAGDSRFRQLQ
jgi:soluble cytochrome b562